MDGTGIHGQYPIVSALPVRANTLTFLGAGSTATAEVQADGCPWFNTWFRQLTGAPGVATAEYQFMQGAAAGNVPEWAPLPPLADPVSTTPVLRNFKLGAPRYRILFTVTGACTIQYRVTASV